MIVSPWLVDAAGGPDELAAIANDHDRCVAMLEDLEPAEHTELCMVRHLLFTMAESVEQLDGTLVY